MKLPIPPTPEAALADLVDVLPVLWETLEVATGRAREYFESIDRPVDSCLFPNVVRYHAKFRLDDIEKRRVALFTRQPLANNGLQLRVCGYDLRVLKADEDGDLPPAGDSKSRQNFYQQSLFAGELPAAKCNLILLWDVTAGYTLTSLSLVCPKGAEESKKNVGLYYWMTPVLHPAKTISAPAAAIVPDLELAVAADRKKTGDTGA